MRPVRTAFLLPLAALVSVAAALTVLIDWNLAHPEGTEWDEASYFARLYQDHGAYERGGLFELKEALLLEDRHRPPAYRLLSAPVHMALGPDVRAIRTASLLCFLMTLYFVYRSGALFGGTGTGFVAVCIVACSPAVLSSMRSLGTEWPLLLGLSGLTYFLLRIVMTGRSGSGVVLGIGLCAALAALGKLSFAPVALPMLLAAIVLARYTETEEPKFSTLLLPGLIALAVISPFYLANIYQYYWYGHTATEWSSHGLYFWLGLAEPGSGFFLLGYMELLAFQVFGPLLSTALALTIVLLLTRLYKRRAKTAEGTSPAAGAFLVPTGILTAAILPLVILHMSGGNQNPRFLVPIVPIVAVLAAAAAARLLDGWVLKTMALLATVQSVIVLALMPGNAKIPRSHPVGALVAVSERLPQWEWSRLKDEITGYGIASPRIGFIGSSAAFNNRQIEIPWRKAGEDVTVTRLWHENDGAVDWAEVEARIGETDVLLTFVPSEEPRPLAVNSFNSEFADRMTGRPDFIGPVILQLGPGTGDPVFVFHRR